MNKLPDSVRHFLWGAIFGVILVPLLYLARIWWKHRSERVTTEEDEWP